MSGSKNIGTLGGPWMGSSPCLICKPSEGMNLTKGAGETHESWPGLQTKSAYMSSEQAPSSFFPGERLTSHLLPQPPHPSLAILGPPEASFPRYCSGSPTRPPRQVF